MLTKREAAIITCYTGKLIGTIEEAIKYASDVMEREVFTHEFGNKDFTTYLKRKSRDDFVELSKNIV